MYKLLWARRKNQSSGTGAERKHQDEYSAACIALDVGGGAKTRREDSMQRQCAGAWGPLGARRDLGERTR